MYLSVITQHEGGSESHRLMSLVVDPSRDDVLVARAQGSGLEYQIVAKHVVSIEVGGIFVSSDATDVPAPPPANPDAGSAAAAEPDA